MPRVRTSGPTPAVDFGLDLAAGVGGLSLSPAGNAPGCSAAEAAADGFAAGRTYRGYGHDARVFDLAFHPATSGLLISASDDCSVGLWRRQQGGTAAGGRYMQVAAFQGHGDSVMRAAWSPDGHLVASGSSDGVVCLWQPTDAALGSRHNLGHAGTRQLATLEGHPEEVYACIFLDQRQQQQQQQQQQQDVQQPSSTGGGSGAAAVHGLGGCAAGQRLVTASGEALFLWDLATQKLLHEGKPPPPPAGAASEAQVPERWRPGYLFGVAAQPDGPLLGAACSDGRLRLWSRSGGDSALTPLCTLPWNQAMGSDCVFGPGGLFCAVSKDGSLIAMDVRRGGCLQHLQLDAPLLSCTLLPPAGGGRGQVLLAAGADGALHFVDLLTGDVDSLLPEAAPERPLLCAALSADSAWLATSGEAVVLDASDELEAAAGGGGAAAAGGAGHAPPRKWSPIHLWQRRQP